MTEALTSCGPCGHRQPGLCLSQQAWPFLPSWDSASVQAVLLLGTCSLLALPHVLRGDMSVEPLLHTICVTPNPQPSCLCQEDGWVRDRGAGVEVS